MTNTETCRCDSIHTHGCSFGTGTETDQADTAAIESLRTFAVSHNELPFAHLCTAALQGETWAVERIAYFLTPGACIVDATSAINTAHLLNLIAFTDTTRPDGAIARGLVTP